jgi:hypothetical protein
LAGIVSVAEEAIVAGSPVRHTDALGIDRIGKSEADKEQDTGNQYG